MSSKETKVKQWHWKFSIATYFFLLVILFSEPVRAQTLELIQDNNRSGNSPTTVIVSGSPVSHINSLVIADTTGYYEIYPIGTTVMHGNVRISPYAGIEGMKGVPAKVRGLVVVGYATGSFNFTTLVEFAGNTGNFNRQIVTYKDTNIHYSLVRHSFAGTGIRIDVITGRGVSPYIQLLERRTTIGLVANF